MNSCIVNFHYFSYCFYYYCYYIFCTHTYDIWMRKKQQYCFNDCIHELLPKKKKNPFFLLFIFCFCLGTDRPNDITIYPPMSTMGRFSIFSRSPSPACFSRLPWTAAPMAVRSWGSVAPARS